jgi:hypothetical protein
MDTSKNGSIIRYTLVGALAFLVAGIVEGFVLLRYEAMLGFPVEGIIGGLIFGLFIREHIRITRTVLASLVAIVIGLFGGAFIGLLIYDGYYIPSIISGFLVGGLFGLIIGAGKESVYFALVGAVVFFAGDMIVDSVNVWEGGFYNSITELSGEQGYQVVIVAMTALYHGIAIGLGTGIYLKNKRGKLS